MLKSQSSFSPDGLEIRGVKNTLEFDQRGHLKGDSQYSSIEEHRTIQSIEVIKKPDETFSHAAENLFGSESILKTKNIDLIANPIKQSIKLVKPVLQLDKIQKKT